MIYRVVVIVQEADFEDPTRDPDDMVALGEHTFFVEAATRTRAEKEGIKEFHEVVPIKFTREFDYTAFAYPLGVKPKSGAKYWKGPGLGSLRKDARGDLFVWYRGRVWRYEGLPDRHGRVSIVSLRDPSFGKGVDPLDLYPVNQETHQAVVQWLERRA